MNVCQLCTGLVVRSCAVSEDSLGMWIWRQAKAAREKAGEPLPKWNFNIDVATDEKAALKRTRAVLKQLQQMEETARELELLNQVKRKEQSDWMRSFESKRKAEESKKLAGKQGKKPRRTSYPTRATVSFCGMCWIRRMLGFAAYTGAVGTSPFRSRSSRGAAAKRSVGRTSDAVLAQPTIAPTHSVP